MAWFERIVERRCVLVSACQFKSCSLSRTVSRTRLHVSSTSVHCQYVPTREYDARRHWHHQRTFMPPTTTAPMVQWDLLQACAAAASPHYAKGGLKMSAVPPPPPPFPSALLTPRSSTAISHARQLSLARIMPPAPPPPARIPPAPPSPLKKASSGNSRYAGITGAPGLPTQLRITPIEIECHFIPVHTPCTPAGTLIKPSTAQPPPLPDHTHGPSAQIKSPTLVSLRTRPTSVWQKLDLRDGALTEWIFVLFAVLATSPPFALSASDSDAARRRH